MVFTRGKNPSNADEDRNPERSVQDDGEPEPLVLERSSSRIKERSLEEGRETPSVMGSIKSQSVLRTSSRTTSRKGTYILDVSVEETPLSQRHSLSQSGKGKRLKLYSEEQPSGSRRGNTKYSEGHSSESVDEQEDHHKHMSKRQQWNPVESDEQVENHDEDAFENTNGIRRSTRTRKLTYGTFNTSWLFGTQSAKGYPCMDPQEEEDEENKRSTKMRTRQRGNTIDEEHNHISDGDEASRDTTNNLRSPSQKRTSRRVCVMKKEPQYEDDMYSRVKRLPRSANHYKNYRTTTVSSAKRTRNVQPSRRSSRYNQLPSSDDDSSLESEVGNENEEGSDSGAEDNHNEPNGEEKERAENGQVNANANDSGQMVDGRRVKGNYLLRKIQPMVDRFQPMDLKQRGDSPPRLRAGSNRRAARMICSPAHRTLRKRRQRAQNASSTSSSSSDDERFERRKNKSMVKARNRCLPMNFSPDDVNQGVIKDRMKIGSSLADVDPMNIDRNVTFEQVGGLETYIRSLKEMILFPLLYPEVFQKFAIQAPRGVLFYGPPGTGKTLVARALANECGQKDRRVAFFMRKGADCLSKWVGESERQLRLLFDQAYQMRPSIIFFDEIDGLAPVRSTRQDQIHSSIVSTLLALMDGLDSRGEVIIIGATNRLDAIDPALRRPGRFDREFHFPLPSLPARKEILGIHLKSWQPAPPASLIHHLSEKTVGYCGADLKALCAEAALLALRRRYPQVYASKDKLQLDLSQINVERRDFVQAVQRLVPASQRSTSAAGKPLADVVAPLLSNSLHLLIQHTQRIFPNGMAVLRVKGPLSGSRRLTSNQFSPRLLITGDSCSQLASALLHYMERLPVHRLDLTTLYGLSVRNPEEACVQLFQEARRNVPSIIYLPQVSRWWPAINETVRATFLSLLTELDPELPILLLATHDSDLNYCAEDVVCLFDGDDDEIFVTALPSSVERRNFFHPVVVEKSLRAPFTKKKNREQLEVLPLAEAAPERQLNDAEKARVERNEEATLCELRIFLREILAKMARNKLFFMFTRPVDTQEVPDYLEIIHKPMDLETMMTKIDQHCYESAKDFLADIDQICANALEYNPDRDPEDKLIRHRACTLRDTACALIKAEMDTDFEEQCQEISRTRKARLATVEPPVETKNPADVTAVQTPGEIDSAVTTQTSIKDNGEKQESADTSATRKRRKASAWSRGNPTSRRYHKKNKIDMDSSTTNATHDTLNNHGQTNGIDANPSASLLDMSSKTIDTAERTTSSQGSLPSVEVSLALDSSVAPTDACTAIDDSMLSESHCSDVADPPDADQAAETSTLPVTDTPLPVKVVHIDTNQLEQLLGKLVTQTEHYSLNRLLRLYSKLNRVVVRFSKLWDRTLLIKELEAVVDRSNTAEK